VWYQRNGVESINSVGAALGPADWFEAQSQFLNDHILLRLHFPSGRATDAWWILDTGSTHNLIDERYAQALQPKQIGLIEDVNKQGFKFRSLDVEQAQLLGSSGPVPMDRGSVPVPMDRGSVPVPMHRVGALDLSKLGRAITQGNGENVVGVVGYPFLSNYLVVLDFRSQRVWLKHASAVDGLEMPPGGSRYRPLLMRAGMNNHRLLVLPLRLEPDRQAGRWSLDTGSNISIVTHEYAVQHGIQPSAHTAQGPGKRAQLINRQVQVEPRTFDVQFGEAGGHGPRLESQTIYVPNQPFAEAVAGLDGNLGVNLLKPFRVLIDYAHRAVLID
jgi:hypothetical protein